MSLTSTAQAVQSWSPAFAANAPALTFADQCHDAITAIAEAMRSMAVTTIALSNGKDSSTVLGLTLEAARRLKSEGTNPRIRLITADTLVEAPAQAKLNLKMSARALKFAEKHGLDLDQIWVTPDPADHYLVTMIGGRGTASLAGSDATCSVSLKVRPMDAARRKMAKEYGAENILTLIGTRFDESTERGINMRDRGESATTPIQASTGSYTLSPIAHWSEADVWRLLNGNPRTIGFKTLDFTPVITHYEAMGDSTCQTLSVAETTAKSKSPCKGGRGGCWTCMKVSKDHSLENMVSKFPYYENLVRIAKAIRAGHFVPENRSWISKGLDENGQVRVFSNSYSPEWTAQLLKWVMSVDANEDDRAMRRSQKLGRPVERRFPRLLEPEHEFMIHFYWTRYGVQKPGRFIRIKEAIAQGKRWPLPTDAELAALEARGNKKLMGKTMGHLDSDHTEAGKPVFSDHWRDLIGTETGCSPDVMLTEDGDRAWYRNTAGLVHDSMATSAVIEADISSLREPDGSLGITYHDFLWWMEMEFADGQKTNNDEMNFLIREGIIKARPGYQSQLAQYQRYNRVLDRLRERGPIDSLEAIQAHPGFTASTGTAPKAPAIIATSAQPAVDKAPKATQKHTDAEQLDLLLA
ncbi:phosphoadenosine phosphosulfate reductase family protein [Marinobacter sp. C18]|uniref:phosphoadenosine phosphosulfate reductase family protein n=1 Tax=Marinobacter sp. C18 TaxID=1772288 RepID=UPI000A9404BE|nr:phosphoadenosine phosphosulfate reductase family protein [Marinobacter sp. C18]